MRIAYLARWDVTHESGILKKMIAQMRVWARHGHDVRYFVFSPGNSVWDGIGEIAVRAFHGDDLRRRLFRRRAPSREILDWRPDIAYVRWSTYYPAWERVMARVPAVVELNGDDVRDNRISLPYPLYVAHVLSRSRLLRRADGMVSVSRQLAGSPMYTRFGKPIVVIGNGVDLSAIPRLPAPSNPHPRLIFVGYASREWHGVDKLRALAARYPEWRIDIVGVDEADQPNAAPANIHLHGHLPRDQYQELLARADVAVGTLALHRKQLETTSALKTGEYLAYGIPTIIGYEDTDFPEGHPHILQLPNTEDNVAGNLETIRGFVERMRGQRVDRESIRHLDVEAKERERLRFMSGVLATVEP